MAACGRILRELHCVDVGIEGAVIVHGDAFYQAYGETPVARPARDDARPLRVARSFCRRWDPTGEGINLWRERARITQEWHETEA